MPSKEDNALWKKILFRAGTIVRFNKDWVMKSWDGKRYLRTIQKGELAVIEKVNFNDIYFLRLKRPGFSISVVNLKEVDLSYIEIVTGKESEEEVI